MGDRPRVVLVAASSLDGKLSTVDRRPVTWTSRADRARLFSRRDAADAILVGGATVRAEDPPLLPTPERRAARQAAGKAPDPLRVVVSRTLDLPLGRALRPAPGADVLAWVPPDASPAGVAALTAAGVAVWRLGEVAGETDLRLGLERLWAERGVRELELEGGGDLNAAFFAADLVDEVHLTLCPVVLGGAGAPTLVDGPGLDAGWFARRARLVESRAVGDELFVTWELRGRDAPGASSG